MNNKEETTIEEEIVKEAVETSEAIVEEAIIRKKPTIEELEESLSPLEKELLILLRKEKGIPFFELNKINPRYLGAQGKLIQRGFAKTIKNMKKPKSERKILVLIEEEKEEQVPQSSAEAN